MTIRVTPIIRRSTWFAILALLVGCNRKTDSPPRSSAPLAAVEQTGSIMASPDSVAEVRLASEDSVIGIVSSPFVSDAILLLQSAKGGAWLERWHGGDSTSSVVLHFPPGFAPHGIAAHPAEPKYFVSGMRNGKSQILVIDASTDTWTTKSIFESSREIGRLIVGSRPFNTDSGKLHRIFFEAKIARGGPSLRSITERGGAEYQVVGPASDQTKLAGVEDAGTLASTSGVPLATHPRGEPLLWQDTRGCTHLFGYSEGWQKDKVISEIPCDGTTVFAPNGNAYLHWTNGRPGVKVFGPGVVAGNQAVNYTFLTAPVPTPDGKGVFGIISKADSKRAIAFVPIAVPLGDVANAWQQPTDACDANLLSREGGLFRETNAAQLYSVYDRYNYSDSPEFRVPFLVTTDVFWDNFGAAFNGVFILLEKNRAIDAFWAFADSANEALSRGDTTAKWARVFANVVNSRNPNPTGDAAAIAGAAPSGGVSSVDPELRFDELKPRSHYTASPELQHYFRAVHYITEISRRADAQPLATLPASVHRSARRWIDVYLPFISAPRGRLVWAGATAPGVAPYAKYRRPLMVFPLSWGLDNEVLGSTAYDSLKAASDQIKGPSGPRVHPSGIDVATAYGNNLARALLGPDLKTYPPLGPVLDAIIVRRPKVSESSSVYERWLDALGAEWADAVKFPGAPEKSQLWDVKRLQTGLASWATLREATILVNERPQAAEAGEGGFEELVFEAPRGYVEPAPKTFEAIATLYESLARVVDSTSTLDRELRRGIANRLDSSAAEARRFGGMADHELRGEALADSDYAAIQDIAGLAEHEFLLYKGIANKDEGLPTPDPMPKIADVAGNPFKEGTLEAAVGNPLEWRQIVPYFGRRQMVVGAVYSYHEFVSNELYDNERWRKEVATHAHPSWVQPMIAPIKSNTCAAPATP